MDHFTDFELLVAAGLLSGSKRHNDCFYGAWIGYNHELRRRGLRWDEARRTAARMEKRTGYPKRGWERRYEKAYQS